MTEGFTDHDDGSLPRGVRLSLVDVERRVQRVQWVQWMGLIPEPKKTAGLLLHYFSMTGVHSRELRGVPRDKVKGGNSYSAKDLGAKVVRHQ